MNANQFYEMDTSKRVTIINKMLEKYESDALARVAEELGIRYGAFCKEMLKDDYVYIKRENKYYKFIREIEHHNKLKNDYLEELDFIRNNLQDLKSLVDRKKDISFVLDKKVYSSNKVVNKTIKISEDIYEEFLSICEAKFNYLKIQDIISQCLLEFINKYKDQ